MRMNIKLKTRMEEYTMFGSEFHESVEGSVIFTDYGERRVKESMKRIAMVKVM